MADRERLLLLDTNLLVLLLVGTFDRRLIGRKRLDTYSPADFDALVDLVDTYQKVLTTPHLLAELSNLTDQIVPKGRKLEFRETEREFIGQLDERWCPANVLCATGEFSRLGLADAAVCQLSVPGVAVLSVDAQLCATLAGRGVSVQNFNHLRDA